MNTNNNSNTVDLLALVAAPTASTTPSTETIDPVGTFLETLTDLIVPLESMTEMLPSCEPLQSEQSDTVASTPLPVDGLMMYLQVAQMPVTVAPVAPVAPVVSGIPEGSGVTEEFGSSPLPLPPLAAPTPSISTPVISAVNAPIEVTSAQPPSIAKLVALKGSAKPHSLGEQSCVAPTRTADVASDMLKAVDSADVMLTMPDSKAAGEIVLAAGQAMGPSSLGPIMNNNGPDVWVVGQTQPVSSDRQIDDVRVPRSATPVVLQERVGSTRWGDELATRITLMTAQGQQHGSLRLSPEHLGPLEVRIHVSQDTANVWFGAQHDETRAALQDAIPRLRELFAASGISLGQANVSRQAPRQSQSSQSGLRTHGGREDFVTHEITSAARTQLGLVDTYA
jgi:Flagellar hook-length control protein FliK